MRYITMRRRDTEQIVRTASINSNEVIRGLTWIRLTLSLRNYFLGLTEFKCYFQLCVGYFVMVFLLF